MQPCNQHLIYHIKFGWHFFSNLFCLSICSWHLTDGPQDQWLNDALPSKCLLMRVKENKQLCELVLRNWICFHPLSCFLKAFTVIT